MQRPRKFTIQNKLMDFTSKINHVLASTSCDRHSAPISVPCWDIESDTTKFFGKGICGRRASMIYTGTVSDTARSNKRPKKEHS